MPFCQASLCPQHTPRGGTSITSSPEERSAKPRGVRRRGVGRPHTTPGLVGQQSGELSCHF
jgi:hypothetical protein